MRIKTVSYSESIETIWGYGLKKWIKAASEIEFDGDKKDNPDNAYALAKQLVKEQISKELEGHIEQRGTKIIDVHDPNFVKKDMDIIIRGIYNNAVKNNDYDTIDKIKLEYNVEPK